MNIRDRIRFMSALPPRFNTMLEQALRCIGKPDEQHDLCVVTCVVSNAAWKFWHSNRQPQDNRKEHEWVVFANVLKIAEDEQLSPSEKRIATAFTFTHDSFFIPRIMEQSVREASDEERERLREQKRQQRIQHMDGGAKNTEFLLRQLKRPDSPAELVFTPEEIDRCVAIVRRHDMWKLDRELPPPTTDKLAVTCLEGDALWPLHPLGVLADLERPDKEGNTKDFSDSQAWHKQLTESLKTLTTDFRPKWKEIPRADFKDDDSIFRTSTGHSLFSGWRKRWNI